MLIRIKNISVSLIRHISIDSIEVIGYRGHFDSTVCNNQKDGTGFGVMLRSDEKLDITITFCTNAPKKLSYGIVKQGA